MALLTTERLLQEVKDGTTKVGTDDRRRIVRYLMSVQPDMANTDMADLFGISEGAIRKDKKTIREDMAKELAEDDITLVVTDIVFNFRRQLRDLEASKAKCLLGSTEYRLHCKEILDIELRKTAALQNLGYLPKNLGNLTVDRYEYAAVVLKGDQVESRLLTMFDDKTQEAIRSRQARALGAGQVIDAEIVEPEQRSVSFGE